MTAPTVMLAGGLGTRVASITGAAGPKAMLDVGGRPFIDRKIDELLRNDVTEVFVLTGHGAEALRQHLNRHGFPGLKIHVLHDGNCLLGTGGAVAAALPHLPELFWVTYGDTLLDLPMAPIESTLPAESDGVLVVVQNCDTVQPSNTSIEGDLVVAYSKGDPPGTHDCLDYGLMLLRRSAFAGSQPEPPFDLGDVLRALIARRALRAHVAQAEFHDIGTPEAWAVTSDRYQSR